MGAKFRQNRAQNDQKFPLRRRAAPVEHLSMLARGSAPAAPQALGAAGGENFEILPNCHFSLRLFEVLEGWDPGGFT